MNKEIAIKKAKEFRQRADALLQEMKQHKGLLVSALEATAVLDRGEVIAQHTLSIRDLESCIMRQGMTLKYVGQSDPYPASMDPSSTVVEPTLTASSSNPATTNTMKIDTRETTQALRSAAHEIRRLRLQVIETKAEAWDVHSEVIKRLFSGSQGMCECAAHRAERLADDLESEPKETSTPKQP